jgi:hypothetical protein
MISTFHLDFDPHQADHRRAAEWLAAQPDPAEAVARLIGIVNEGEERLLQWEELATLLASEVRELRTQLAGLPQEAEFQSEEVHENPESARRLDSMFG